MKDGVLGQTGEEELVSEAALSEKEFSLPAWIRWTGIGIFSTTFLVFFGVLIYYLLNPTTGLEPSKVGVGNLIMFCLFGLIAFSIPWGDYGLRIRKFGPFEFEQILSAQATEHATELNELRERIQKLEDHAISGIASPDRGVEERSEGEVPLSYGHDKKLEELLFDFLEYYDDWAFSPSRIAGWGSEQDGFEDLAQDVSEIRRTLQAMVAKGRLTTRISKKGNTLYRVPI